MRSEIEPNFLPFTQQQPFCVTPTRECWAKFNSRDFWSSSSRKFIAKHSLAELGTAIMILEKRREETPCQIWSIPNMKILQRDEYICLTNIKFALYANLAMSPHVIEKMRLEADNNLISSQTRWVGYPYLVLSSAIGNLKLAERKVRASHNK